MPKNVPSLHRRPNRHDPLYLFFETMVPSLIHLNDSTVFISHCNRTLLQLEKPSPTEKQLQCPRFTLFPDSLKPSPDLACRSLTAASGWIHPSKFWLPNEKLDQRIVRTWIPPMFVHRIPMVNYSLRFLSSRLQIVDKKNVLPNQFLRTLSLRGAVEEIDNSSVISSG